MDIHATGFQDMESNTPMRTDTMFRIASMTKPITSVAVMMLYEEGKLFLTDPVSKFIPAFKGQQVLEQGADKPVPARRQITIRDLLTHRSGITYGFINGGAVGNGYRKNGVTDGLTTTTMTLAEAIDKLAAEPLVAQPGTAYNYSLSTDVLGRVVEVVSGQPFEVFLRERIFKPLKMIDTDFVVPESKWSRMATVYSPDGSSGIRPMKDPESFGNTHMSPIAYYKSKTYFSGGAGLVSTAADYARFGQMLLNGGSLDGAQILSPKTIELMTRESHRRPGEHPDCRCRLRVGSRLPRAHRSRRDAGHRLGRQLRLERHLRHELLGRSEGEAGRDHAGAAVSGVNGCGARSSRSSIRR